MGLSERLGKRSLNQSRMHLVTKFHIFALLSFDFFGFGAGSSLAVN